MNLSSSTALGVPLPASRPLRAYVLSSRRPVDRDVRGGEERDGPQDSNSPVSERLSRSVLWVDDQVQRDDPSVRVLTLEGFRVHCAASGAAGLAMARESAYDAIILDLRLPDTSGLALLKDLRASGVWTPVLVLTGYGDLESAVAALRLGAVDFQRKPLIAEELVAAVRTVAAARAEPAGPSAPGEHAQSEAVEALVAHLGEIGDTIEQDRAASERIALALMTGAEHPALPISTFLACADGLRRVLAALGTPGSHALVQEVRHAIELSRAGAAIDHRTVRRALASIEAAVTRGVRPTQSEIARELAVDPAHLGRVIRSRTGRGFRQWRSAFALRLAVRELADRDTQIAQIAFRAGYEHPSQLDREFRRLFTVSPRQYRRLRDMLLRSTA